LVQTLKAEEEFPGLETDSGKTTFCSYDIDNPGAKVLWAKVLATVVPLVAAHPATFSWELANEPGFYAKFSSFDQTKRQ
jgi:hypothetical protein